MATTSTTKETRSFPVIGTKYYVTEIEGDAGKAKGCDSNATESQAKASKQYERLERTQQKKG